MLFQKHQVVTKHGLLMAILTINKKVFAEEFSLENGNIPSENAQLKSAALDFLEKNYPTLQIKVVRIMVGKVPFVTFHIQS
ncbi:hypothetical protein IM538_21725 [Cytobacillus suaedae]|nr:hypothetical protein IM538_21725 [Cytobacillus suaedae]